MRNHHGTDSEALGELCPSPALFEVVGKVHDAYLSAPLSIVNSAALPHELRPWRFNLPMQTVEATRQARLLVLIEEYGSLAALNAKLDLPRTDSTLSQIKNASIGSKSSKPKTMGSDLARRLEAATNKPEGWMDNDPENTWPFERIAPSRWNALKEREKGVVEDAALRSIKEIEAERGDQLLARTPSVPRKRA